MGGNENVWEWFGGTLGGMLVGVTDVTLFLGLETVGSAKANRCSFMVETTLIIRVETTFIGGRTFVCLG